MAVIHLHQNRINPLVLPVIFAKELGYFDRYQVEVDLRLADTFIFNGKAEFLEGKVEAMMGDTTFFFYYLEEGKQASITSTLTRTIQLIGRKDLTDEHTLKVGVNRTGLFSFFRKNYLSSALKQSELVYINNTYERIDALKAGQIDALVAIEPFISEVKEQYQGKVLWHSNEIDHCFVMWCFDETFIEEHPEDVRHFHLALEEAGNLFNQLSPDQKEAYCIKYAGYSKEAAQRLRDFQFESQKNYAADDFNECQNWMYEEGEIKKIYKADEKIFQTFEESKKV